jgi:Secretion system C-terminal sorting domain/PKD domain
LTNVKGNINVLTRADTTIQQYYILKYDTNAVLQSYFPITDSGTINTWSVTSDNNGNIYIGGYTDNVGPSSKITIYGGHQVPASKSFLFKFDKSGVFKWIKMNDDTHTAITDLTYNENNGNIYACGGGGGYYTVGDTGTRYGSFRLLNPVTSTGYNRDDSPLMIAFDTSGNVLGGNIVGMRYVSSAFGIDVSNVNHILIGGRAVGHTSIGSDTFNTNGQDGFYAELNSDLEFIGGATLNGPGFYDQVSKVAYDERGNIYVGGYMAGDLYLPGDTLRKIPGGNSNLFIAKYGVPTCTCPYAVANYTDAFTSSLKYTFTSSASNADTIWWEFGDGNTQRGGTTATHTYATAGNYTVCQHVSNVCSDDEFCKSVSVVTGINDVKESYSAIIYPNPASTSIHIHIQGGDLPENSQYVLFDITGKQILNGKINGDDTSITLSSSVTDGVYLLQINNRDGVMLMSKRVEVVR